MTLQTAGITRPTGLLVSALLIFTIAARAQSGRTAGGKLNQLICGSGDIPVNPVDKKREQLKNEVENAQSELASADKLTRDRAQEFVHAGCDSKQPPAKWSAKCKGLWKNLRAAARDKLNAEQDLSKAESELAKYLQQEADFQKESAQEAAACEKYYQDVLNLESPPSTLTNSPSANSPCNGAFHAADGSVYRLTVYGNQVTGNYVAGPGPHSGIRGSFQGTISGNTVSAQYTAHEGRVAGSGTMTMICGPGATISVSYRSSDGKTGTTTDATKPASSTGSSTPDHVSVQLVQAVPDSISDPHWNVSSGNITNTGSGYTVQVSWNPPGSMDNSGVLITIQSQAHGWASASADISGDFLVEDPSNGAAVGDKLAFIKSPPNGSNSGSQQVRIRPRLPLRNGQTLKLRIGISFGYGVTYQFRAST